jgi:NAD(P)-dependent dehydrogenase (short-subunit alcohol dehydrogenase family)
MTNVAIVTGANRGLGLALVRGLCARWGEDGLVYLTARNAQAGQQALAQLRSEGLRPAFHLLDIGEDQSVRAFAEHVCERHGGVDVLIQNAACAAKPDVASADQVRTMVNINNLGTYRMLRALRPLFRTNARVVVLASGFGTLTNLPAHLHERFDAAGLSMEDINHTMLEYATAVEQGRDQADGWPAWINIASKVGQVATTRIFARELQHDSSAPRGILVNAACPGWTDTDAARPYLEKMPHIRAKTPDEAAVDVIWLATLPKGASAPHSELVQYRRPIPFNA